MQDVSIISGLIRTFLRDGSGVFLLSGLILGKILSSEKHGKLPGCSCCHTCSGG